jgi:hypothetical protein
MKMRPNNPAAGKAGIAPLFAIEHHRPTLRPSCIMFTLIYKSRWPNKAWQPTPGDRLSVLSSLLARRCCTLR